MTNGQKECITAMRLYGCSYLAIAKAVGLTNESVKTYCRTHELAGAKAASNGVTPDQDFSDWRETRTNEKKAN